MSVYYSMIKSPSHQVADEKLYEHWRANCPDLREVESNEIKKHVVTEWGKQKERKDQVKMNMYLCIALEID